MLTRLPELRQQKAEFWYFEKFPGMHLTEAYEHSGHFVLRWRCFQIFHQAKFLVHFLILHNQAIVEIHQVIILEKKHWCILKKLLVKYELDEASEIDKHTNLCKILATSKNIKKVEIENTKLFKIKIEKIDKKIFEMRGFFGCFVEYDTKNINDIAFLSNNIVQTLSYFGVEKSDILNIIDKDKLKGFDRVVPIGKALEMDMVWDGYQLPYALSRIIN